MRLVIGQFNQRERHMKLISVSMMACSKGRMLGFEGFAAPELRSYEACRLVVVRCPCISMRSLGKAKRVVT
jgi:hypothetical protein